MKPDGNGNPAATFTQPSMRAFNKQDLVSPMPASVNATVHGYDSKWCHLYVRESVCALRETSGGSGAAGPFIVDALIQVILLSNYLLDFRLTCSDS